MEQHDLMPTAGHSILTDLDADRRIGLDPIDAAPLRTLPEGVASAAEPTLLNAITVIYREGARGSAHFPLFADALSS